MKNKLYLFLVLMTFFCAFFLRFHRLGVVPNGLNGDETAIGYNAFLILHTGKDEYGKKFPLYFKSFNDYKLPVYIYTTVPSIALFGLTEYAVRFPSALSGFLTVIVLYFLVRELSRRKDVPLIAAFLLAVNPWHVFLSRAAFEVNLSVFFVTLGAFLFVFSMKKNVSMIFLSLSIISFFLALYCYNVTRLTAPLLLGSLIVIYRKKLFSLSRISLMFIVMLIIVGVLPFLLTFASSSGFSGQQSVMIQGGNSLANILEIQQEVALQFSPWFVKTFFNTYVLIAYQYIRNIGGFLSIPYFFSFGQPGGTTNIDNMGMFYSFELPLVIAGFIVLFQKKTKEMLLFFYWFVISVLVVSWSAEVPHGTRAFIIVIPMVVLSAYGSVFLFDLVKKISSKIFQRAIFLGFAAFASYSILYFFVTYFVRMPVLFGNVWRPQDKALALYLKSEESKHEKIIVDSDADFIYTSLLFYQQVPPDVFFSQAVHEPDSLFVHLEKMGKYQFRKIDWVKDYYCKTCLLVGGGSDIPGAHNPTKTFYYPSRPDVAYVNKKYVQFPVQDAVYNIYIPE